MNEQRRSFSNVERALHVAIFDCYKHAHSYAVSVDGTVRYRIEPRPEPRVPRMVTLIRVEEEFCL